MLTANLSKKLCANSMNGKDLALFQNLTLFSSYHCQSRDPDTGTDQALFQEQPPPSNEKVALYLMLTVLLVSGPLTAPRTMMLCFTRSVSFLDGILYSDELGLIGYMRNESV
jgi:hypothetical protein